MDGGRGRINGGGIKFLMPVVTGCDGLFQHVVGIATELLAPLAELPAGVGRGIARVPPKGRVSPTRGDEVRSHAFVRDAPLLRVQRGNGVGDGLVEIRCGPEAAGAWGASAEVDPR